MVSPVLDSGIPKGFVDTAMDVTAHDEPRPELGRREGYLAEAQRLSHTRSFGWRVASEEISWWDQTFQTFAFNKEAIFALLSLIY